MIYVITFILAFCSIAYELLLGQTLSAFLGNTVLRYSVTIGLYMMSLGIGSMIAEGRFVQRPVMSLLLIEICLTILGGGAVVFLFFVNALGAPAWVLSLAAHMLILGIGILSGFEIPLLINLKQLESQNKDNAIIGVNYLGAFLGTMVFAFILYPSVGLIPTAFFVASLNAFTGLLLIACWRHVAKSDGRSFKMLASTATSLLLMMIGCLYASPTIYAWVLNTYLT